MICWWARSMDGRRTSSRLMARRTLFGAVAPALVWSSSMSFPA